jgi:Domain of unknown function (DUF397)
MYPAEPDFSGATWFTSSYTDGNGGSCVEVAVAGGWVGVRDSKQHGRGPVHAFPADEWSAFLAAVRADEFDQRRDGR